MSETGRTSTRALAALEHLYRDLDAVLAREKPRCEASGRCCRFEASGLTLFATRLEVDLWARGWDPARHPWRGDSHCPFFVGGRCENRDGRPLGCRIYFCDPRWTGPRQETRSAEFHARLRRLHEATGAAYAYGPALRLLGDTKGDRTGNASPSRR